MDFAAEPIMDAFTPRAVTRPNTPAADAGATFDEHLEAASETPAPENVSPASDNAKFDTGTCETTPAPNVETHVEDQIDPDVALLGGPIPAPPPQISAPVLVQIAATQAAPAQTQSADAPATSPPVNATPQTPVAPTLAAPASAATTPIAPTAPAAPNTAKSGASEAKSNAASPTLSTQQQTAGAPAASAQTETATPQTTPVAPNAEPLVVHQLPEAVRQAIAATIATAPQVTETIQRTSRAAPQAVEAKTPEATAKSAAAAPNTATKTQTARAVTAPAIATEAAPAPQMSGNTADTTQISVSTTATQASTHVQHAAADVGTQRAAPAATQVGQEVIRRFNGGNTSFELRLDPAELGRVEVRMEVSRDHKVTAVITADNPQALTELARQSRELEAQLQSAGLQLSDSGLSFDLRQGASGREAQDANGAQRGGGGEDAPVEQAQTPTARPIGFERWRGVRVDMMV